HAALGIAVAALPLLLVTAALAALGVAIARSLRDEAVLDGLRTEVRSIGEVQRAVHEVRTAATGRTTVR
ncbi:MAG TPA: hypothetical protein DCS55_04990, partial [Acidimicrobiaceae bacterium]|nr:hypothetical protein [Acidimicrobiaceae bacterium]